jgi:hypothetical protein
LRTPAREERCFWRGERQEVELIRIQAQEMASDQRSNSWKRIGPVDSNDNLWEESFAEKEASSRIREESKLLL